MEGSTFAITMQLKKAEERPEPQEAKPVIGVANL
jgi:hypothetical protein